MAELTPDQRRARLQRFMDDHKLNINSWSLRADMRPNSLYNFMKGRSESISQKTIEKLAGALKIHPGALFDGSQERNISDIVLVNVRGAVQAGVWLEAMEWPEMERYNVAVPDETGELSKSFGLVVKGTSMDKEYPPGTVLICTNIYDLDDEVRNGDHVIVERRSLDGLIEATCKEYIVESDSAAWLWPRSNDPKHQTPIPIMNGEFDENNDKELRISAIVLGSYRPRKRPPQ